MQTLQMALLLDRLFELEGKPVKERSTEEKHEVSNIRGKLSAALPRILTSAGVKDKDKPDYRNAVLSNDDA